jgi:hypothetical protein
MRANERIEKKEALLNIYIESSKAEKKCWCMYVEIRVSVRSVNVHGYMCTYVYV